MKRDRAEMMRRLRKKRKADGLVEIRAWLTPDHKELIERQIKCLAKTKG